MKQQWNRRRASAARRVPLAASLISQSSERLSPHRKSGAEPRGDKGRQPRPRSALGVGPAPLSHSAGDASLSLKCQHPAEKVISTLRLPAHIRNSVSYQNRVFPYNSQIRF